MIELLGVGSCMMAPMIFGAITFYYSIKVTENEE
jgi:hypothetical protein